MNPVSIKLLLGEMHWSLESYPEAAPVSHCEVGQTVTARTRRFAVMLNPVTL